MFSPSVIPVNSQFKPPEIISLESEIFEQIWINPLTSSSDKEATQWQFYLNRLVLFGFEQWLRQRASSHLIDRTQCINQNNTIYNLKIDEFRLNLIVKEHILDEITEIPKEAIIEAELAAHFYVLLEVSEEQETVMIRGFLRHDRLTNYCSQFKDCLQNDYYQIPLSIFDFEINHLLFYCDFLEPTAIPLPMVSKEYSPTRNLMPEMSSTRSQEASIQLGQWIEGIFTTGWQGINDLFHPQAVLALGLRNQGEGAKRGKLIDLGMDFQGQKILLLVNVTEEADNKLSVLVQLHPGGEERYLPQQITLTLLSQTGKKLQEVRSRIQDNYIQLKSFKGRSGIPFNIAISLGDICIYENFQL